MRTPLPVGAGPRHSGGRMRMRAELRRYLPFLIPCLVVMAVILIYPLLRSFQLSLYAYYLPAPPPIFVGLEHFTDILGESLFWTALKRTSVFVAFGVTTQFLIGFLLALLLNRDGLRGRTVFLTVLLMPLVITPVVGGLMMKWMFIADWGLVNYLLSLVGIHGPAWLGATLPAMGAVVLADTWTYTPFIMLVLLAGLQAVSSEHLEAARVDGAGRLAVFRYIVLPTLKPLILFVLVIRFMDAFRAFDHIIALTSGGPGTATLTMTLYNYFETFQRLSIGRGAAIGAMTLLILSVVITILIYLMYAREKGEW